MLKTCLTLVRSHTSMNMSVRCPCTFITLWENKAEKQGLQWELPSTDLLRDHWKLHEWVGHTHTQWNKNDQWCLWHYCTSLVFFIRGSFLLKYDKLSSPHTHAYTVMFSLSGIPLHTDQLKKRIFFNPNGSFDEVFLFSCTRNKNNIWSLGIVALTSVNLINIVKT